ncbi:MAG: NifB/NifX family molybdenum-iron cluster-binding protein [Candidatus Aminicenantes bacterium]|nr:NifB/NifX family molybdenum-iron cluster-binding protein [Candidatus Aminicenantes bacterium]
MKAAFSCWDERIAPVFDVARQVHVVEVEAGRILNQHREELDMELPLQKALWLSELGVGILVCGAISRPLQAMVISAGIQVIPFISGDLSDVIQAWSLGKFPASRFFMPGCWGHGRRSAGLGALFQEEMTMNGQGQGRGGFGGGRGQGRGGMGRGRGGQGRGRMDGPLAAGAVGSCVCPKCGQRLAHERGVPCVQRQCPQCGTSMIRE